MIINLCGIKSVNKEGYEFINKFAHIIHFQTETQNLSYEV